MCFCRELTEWRGEATASDDVRRPDCAKKAETRGSRRSSRQLSSAHVISSCLYGAIHGLFLSHSFDFSRAILVNFSRRAAPKSRFFFVPPAAAHSTPRRRRRRARPSPPWGRTWCTSTPPPRGLGSTTWSRGREARMAIRDKDMLEKLRLEHRLKSNVKEDLNSNLLEPPQTPRGSSPRRTASARTLRGRVRGAAQEEARARGASTAFHTAPNTGRHILRSLFPLRTARVALARARRFFLSWHVAKTHASLVRVI